MCFVGDALPSCAILVGEESVGLPTSRRDRAFGDPVDSVLGVGVEHPKAVVVDRGTRGVSSCLPRDMDEPTRWISCC